MRESREASRLPAIERLLAEAEGEARALPRWLRRRRAAARARFAELGWPTQKLEAWRYTNLAPLAKIDFAAPGTATADEAALADAAQGHAFLEGLAGPRLLFVNGRFRRPLSALPEVHGLEVLPFADAVRVKGRTLSALVGSVATLNGHALVALNAACMAEGAFVRATRDAGGACVQLAFVGGAQSPVVYHPRTLVVVEPGAELVLVETHTGTAPSAPFWSNAVVEVVLGEGARLRHYRIVAEPEHAYHLAYTAVRAAAGARYESLGAVLGAGLGRDEIAVRLAGEGASCRLDGVYTGRGRERIDNTTLIDHESPRTVSEEYYKGALAGAARGVFRGTIMVREGAQKIDGSQLAKAVLLSDEAEADAKPELLIYADDVVCSHGAAIGSVDEEALFYLRARGLDERLARALLVRGFLGEIVERAGDARLREAIEGRIDAWLEAVDEAGEAA